MMTLVFAAISLLSAFVATFVRDSKRAVLALWVTGLAIGGVYLNLGAELLAIVQWIVCTGVSTLFIFFSVVFGEYGNSKDDSGTEKKGSLAQCLALVLGLGFAAVIAAGAGFSAEGLFWVPSESAQTGNDLKSVGEVLTDKHFLSLEVLGLTLFLVVVGGGVIARPENSKMVQKEKEEVSS